MFLITCVSNGNGLSFNSRRQSRDIEVIRDIKDIVGNDRLFISSYSASLFNDTMQGQNLIISDDCTEYDKNAYYFCEVQVDDKLIDNADALIIYRWNRDYPYDVILPDTSGQFKLENTYDFKGNSHEKITREVYKRRME